MDIDTFKPTFVIQIEGQTLSADITQEITSFVFEDNEEELDVLELAVTDRNLQFVDDPLFQEGNEIVARFGYVGNLSPRKKAVIKDIDYDFPEDGEPGKNAAGQRGCHLRESPGPMRFRAFIFICKQLRHVVQAASHSIGLRAEHFRRSVFLRFSIRSAPSRS